MSIVSEAISHTKNDRRTVRRIGVIPIQVVEHQEIGKAAIGGIAAIATADEITMVPRHIQLDIMMVGERNAIKGLVFGMGKQAIGNLKAGIGGRAKPMLGLVAVIRVEITFEVVADTRSNLPRIGDAVAHLRSYQQVQVIARNAKAKVAAINHLASLLIFRAEELCLRLAREAEKQRKQCHYNSKSFHFLFQFRRQRYNKIDKTA